MGTMCSAPAEESSSAPTDAPAPKPAAAAAATNPVAAGAAAGAGAAETKDGEFVDDDDPDAEEAEEDLSDSDNDEYATPAGKAQGLGATDEDIAAGMFSIEDAAAGDEFMAVKPWIGALKEPEGWEAPAGMGGKPDEGLEVEYVYGYRCRGVYDNVGYLDSGEFVYAAAAVAVIQNGAAGDQRFFQGHTDDILSLALSPDKSMAVTGGKARIGAKGKSQLPRMFVWDTSDGSVISEIQGFHKRSVNCVAFSPDGKYVVSVGGDNDHSVAVHETRSGRKVSTAKGGTDRVINVAWGDQGIVTVGVKHCMFWEVARGALGRGRKGIVGRKGKRCTQLGVAFTADGAWTATASGELYLWRGNQLRKVISAAHKGKICSVAASPDGAYVVSGGDRTVKVWSAAGKLENTIEVPGLPRALAFGTGAAEGKLICGTLNGHIVEITGALEGGSDVTPLVRSHHDGELWGMATHPYDETKVVTCGDDNMIALWDLAERRIIASTVVSDVAGKKATRRGRKESGGASTMSQYPPNQCARAADWGPNGTIAVGTNDGRVIVLNENDLSIVNEDKPSKQWIQAIHYDATGDFLAVGSHDNNIYVYNTADAGLELKSTCKAHNSFITGLDFSQDSNSIHSTCGAYELLFFDTNSGEQLRDGATMLRNEEWATWTLALGWPVQGIFPPYSDGSDINTTARDNASSLLVTGDDDGRVNLFKYPVVKERSKAKRFAGHSSHVTRVRFTLDDARVVSTGGNDNTMIVWKKV